MLVVVSLTLWLVVFCCLSMLKCKCQSIKMQEIGFCYSLQMLTCLSRLKLLRSATRAMGWLTVVKLLSLSRERSVKPGAQCRPTGTTKQQRTSQMRTCVPISRFHWTMVIRVLVLICIIIARWLLSWEGSVLDKSNPLIFFSMETFFY